MEGFRVEGEWRESWEEGEWKLFQIDKCHEPCRGSEQTSKQNSCCTHYSTKYSAIIVCCISPSTLLLNVELQLGCSLGRKEERGGREQAIWCAVLRSITSSIVFVRCFCMVALATWMNPTFLSLWIITLYCHVAALQMHPWNDNKYVFHTS